MERRVGAGAWFAAAGGLALMAPLAFVGVRHRHRGAGRYGEGRRHRRDARGGIDVVRLGGARAARGRGARRRRCLRAVDGVPRRATGCLRTRGGVPDRVRGRVRRGDRDARRCTAHRRRSGRGIRARHRGQRRCGAVAPRRVRRRLAGGPRAVRHAPPRDRLAAAPAFGRVRDDRGRARAARGRGLPRRQRAVDPPPRGARARAVHLHRRDRAHRVARRRRHPLVPGRPRDGRPPNGVPRWSHRAPAADARPAQAPVVGGARR